MLCAGLPALLLTLLDFAPAAAPDFQLQKIGNGVWAAIVNDEGLAGGNAGFVIGDDGVLVIDTFQDPRPAKTLLAEIRKLTPLPIRFVVNTHYHLDHVNGNDVFAAAGATIVAHRNVRAWMRTENIKMLDPPVTPEKKARVRIAHAADGGLRQPYRAVPGLAPDRCSLLSGPHGRRFGGSGPGRACGVLRRHVVEGSHSEPDRRLHQGLGESLDAMQKDYGPSTWVPGHGGVANAQDVLTFRKYLADLRAGVRREQAAGKSGDALVQALLPGLKSSYGKWGFFSDYARLDIEQTAQECRERNGCPPLSRDPGDSWPRGRAP